MLFSFRPMLAVTMFAGFIPLAVIGAPFRSQVEGDIVRRANNKLAAGDKFKVGETEHTLGDKFGSTGSTGSVHSVQGHPDLVAKVFHKDGGVTPRDRKKEQANLEAVGEFHGHSEKDGHNIILATKKPGTHITNTKAWENAKTDDAKKGVLAEARKLTEQQNTHHANVHGIIHTDSHHGNVLFHEEKPGVLHSAHFVDWGNAKAAEKDKKGVLTKKTKDDITKGGTRLMRGVL